ncbi:MAG: precorrin-6A/cobalt-precorrin-6A reductase [Granulosicoccus sp.]|nr:precorrin-6A/cobalt-precorrin-6A reductase [Granulosicoccus sp.]
MLGGTGEAKQIARHLMRFGTEVIYSIAGLVRVPDLDCEIRTGGFSSRDADGGEGLERYLVTNDISLLINSTHPYAATMSSNAVSASLRTGIPCWRYLRPEWQLDPRATLYHFQNTEELLEQLSDQKRPFFTIGQGILNYKAQRPKDQHWIVRSALPSEKTAGITLIESIGPFSYEQDKHLMQKQKVDALISKNSGGEAVAGKLRAAIELEIPIYLMKRPEASPIPDRIFNSVESTCDAISEWIEISG